MDLPLPSRLEPSFNRVLRRFDLLRWFAALSLVCIASISVAGGFFLSRFFERQMLERDAVVSMEFINSIVSAERSEGRPYATEPADRDVLKSGQVLGSFFDHVARLPGVVRANVYSTEGRMLWSSTEHLIGQHFGDNAALETALAGRSTLEWGKVGRSDKREHVDFDESDFGKRFVETYLPIWDTDKARVIGVAEIYKLPTALFDAIDRGIHRIWASTVAGALLTYAALFWVVRRASSIAREQEARVIETETLAAIGEMASAVAHSVRNPLAAIRSSAEVARLEEDRSAADECLQDVIRQVDRVDQWVRDLLGFSRGGEPRSGGSDAVDVVRIARSTVAGFSTVLERRKVAVVFELDPMPLVSAHAGPIGQALQTIVANAIEALPDGGTLTVSGGPSDDGGRVRICISDTGCGLPPGLAGEVFRPFFSTKPNGLGLGLALTRRIVRRYDGEITFSSVEGKGTSVTIALPVAIPRSFQGDMPAASCARQGT